MPKTLKLFKDKNKARIYRNKQRRINYNRGSLTKFNENKHWKTKEIKLICSSLLFDRQLAKLLGRTVRAIQLRRSKEKRILKEG